MEGYINDLAASSGFEEQSVQADRMFHYSIARASHNKVLYYTMISISEVMDFHIKSVRTRLVSKKETMDEFLRQHQKIFDTIKAQDSSRAMQAMKEHLNYVEGLIKKEIEG